MSIQALILKKEKAGAKAGLKFQLPKETAYASLDLGVRT
jgi:hypothetical protein